MNQEDIEIQGTINMFIARQSSVKSKSSLRSIKMACIQFLAFLYDRESNRFEGAPKEFEALRKKKNSILANIEIPRMKKEVLNLKKYYTPNERMLELFQNFKNSTTVTGRIFPISVLTLAMYDSSCRINEIILNTWDNLNEKWIFVPKDLSKTDKEKRVRWLIPETWQLLEEWKEKSKGKYVFKGVLDEHIVWRAYKRAVNFDISPHWMRHTRLVDLAGEGWQMRELAMHAGHDDLNRTKQYIEYMQSAKEKPISFEHYCKKNNIDIKKLVKGEINA